MTPVSISVCIISGEEERRIVRALESVAGWTSEVIVVLNEDARDGTEEICLRHGARVFREPWRGDGPQKASAASKAGSDWLLCLDADEAVSPQLREEIIDALEREARSPRHDAFGFPFLTRCFGRWIRHGDSYPQIHVRLWRRGRARWGGQIVHSTLQVEGPVGRLRSDLLHYSVESMEQQIGKISRYAHDFRTQREGRGVSRFDLFVRPAWRFFRSYVLRLGFLDGWQGWYLAWYAGFYTMARYAGVEEAQQCRGEYRGGDGGDGEEGHP